MKTIRKVFNSIIKDINVADRTLTALVSTAGQDRMDDVLEPKGADVRNFNKNPVVLWAHDYTAPPIAKALWVKKTAEGVLSKMKFASTEFAQEIFELYKEGFLNAFSVGFIPKESEPVDKNSDDFFGGKRFTKWELLEYSAVPVPANPEALALAVSKGVITDKQKDDLDYMREATKHDVDTGTDIRLFDEYGNEVKVPDKETTAKDVEKFLEENGDWEECEGILKFLKINENSLGLEDLMAENKLLEEKILHIEKENMELRYQLYLKLSKEKKDMPGITVDTLADKFVEIVDGVIRQAKGKV